jgi:hypothetical protein
VVARPIGLKPQAVKRLEGQSEDKQKQLRFWTDVSRKLLDKKILDRTQQPKAAYSFAVSLGRSGFHLSNIATPAKEKIGLRLYIHNKNGRGVVAFDELKKHKEDIEKELGEKLDWDSTSQDADSDRVISLRRPFDFNDEAHWDEGTAWMVEWIDKFRKVFVPWLKHLPASAFDKSSDSDSEE